MSARARRGICARSIVAAMISTLTTDAVMTRWSRRRCDQHPVRSLYTAAVTWWATAPKTATPPTALEPVRERLGAQIRVLTPARTNSSASPTDMGLANR